MCRLVKPLSILNILVNRISHALNFGVTRQTSDKNWHYRDALLQHNKEVGVGGKHKIDTDCFDDRSPLSTMV